MNGARRNATKKVNNNNNSRQDLRTQISRKASQERDGKAHARTHQ